MQFIVSIKYNDWEITWDTQWGILIIIWHKVNNSELQMKTKTGNI